MFYDYVDGNVCVCGFFSIVCFEDHDNWKKLVDTNPVKWEFDEDGDISMVEIGQWCDDNLKEGWIVGTSQCGFYNEEDALAFKLRWL